MGGECGVPHPPPTTPTPGRVGGGWSRGGPRCGKAVHPHPAAKPALPPRARRPRAPASDASAWLPSVGCLSGGWRSRLQEAPPRRFSVNHVISGNAEADGLPDPRPERLELRFDHGVKGGPEVVRRLAGPVRGKPAQPKFPPPPQDRLLGKRPESGCEIGTEPEVDSNSPGDAGTVRYLDIRPVCEQARRLGHARQLVGTQALVGHSG